MCYSVYKNVCASFLWLEMRLESNGVWKRIPCTRYHSFCFLHIATWVSFIPFSTLLPCRLLPHHSILFITHNPTESAIGSWRWRMWADAGGSDNYEVAKRCTRYLTTFLGFKSHLCIFFTMYIISHCEISQSEIRGCSQLGCPLHIVY